MSLPEPAVLLLAAVAGTADVAGGYVASVRGIANPRYIIALASGIVIAAAFLELIPAAFSNGQDPGLVSLVMATGFFLFYVIEKLVTLHAHGEEECEAHAAGGIVVAGMAADNVVDGIGIAVAYAVDPALALVLTLAIVAHEIPQGAASAAILAGSGRPRRQIYAVLGLAGIAYVAGAGASSFVPAEWAPAAIAFVAGAFLYIGAGDLLAEAHKRFNVRVVALVVLGAVLMYGLRFLEG